MPERISFIGVDPAANAEVYKRTGSSKKPTQLAWLDDGVWNIEALDVLRMDADEIVAQLADIRERSGIDALIIEGQFVANAGNNIIPLIDMAGQIRAYAQIAGFWVSRNVAPKIWMEEYTGLSIRAGGDALAEMYRYRAQLETGRDNLKEDEAAAVGIATWANAQHWEI